MIIRIICWVALALAILVLPGAFGLVGPVEFSIIMLLLVLVVVFGVLDVLRHRSNGAT